jgi:hypothetical protein
MRKIVIVTAALGLAISSATIVLAAGASAAAPTTDLAVTGSVAGGLRVLGEPSHLVAFTFDLKNKGPNGVTSSADMTFSKVHNGSVVDQLCILPNRSSIEPDSPFCEPGALAAGQTTHMTLILQPTVGGAANRKLSVQVCASTEDSEVDPVASNNCKTLSVTLE